MDGMERLTSREPRVSGMPGVCCTHFEGSDCQAIQGRCADGCPWEEAAWESLASYEDTGLTPKEINEHEAAYIEIMTRTYGPLHQKIGQWLQAEQDGQLVVLPCKVGDLLYEVDLPEYGVITCKVLSIMYYKGPMFHVPGNEVVSSVDVEVEVIEGHGKGSSYNFEIGDFGKTVFLTRQEAEETLRKEAEHG